MIRLRRALKLSLAFAALALVAAPRSAHGQERGAAALDQLVRGLTTTGRVLVIGAHPDDEDTNFLAWLARGHQVHVAYLSLTRGDGGQNIIGNELGEALGAIRTEELLAARRLDGAEQYFSRAYDFGFSKDADETFKQWDREMLTADVVRVIRAYRPQVIVAIWSGTRNDGHGHHEASGLIAKDAYEAAGDTVRFPERSNGRVWVPAKFYRSARFRAGTPTMTFDVGEYDAVLGRSPAQIAAVSRSLHRSQAQGGLEPRGSLMSRLGREATRVNEATPATDERSLFDGVDTTIAHLASLDSIARPHLVRAAELAQRINAELDLRRPDRSVASLAWLVASLDSARGAVIRCGLMPRIAGRGGVAPPRQCTMDERGLDIAIDGMLARARSALLEAAGVRMEVTAQQDLLAFGDSMPVDFTVVNRGHAPVSLLRLALSGISIAGAPAVVIAPDSSATVRKMVVGLVDHRPWWAGGRAGAMFLEKRSPEDGVARVSTGPSTPLVPSVALAEGVRLLSDAQVTLLINGTVSVFPAGEIVHRYADDVMGEVRHPAGGAPAITLELDRGLEWVRANKLIDRRIRLTVRSHTDRTRKLTLKYLLPLGVTIVGAPDSVSLESGEVREIFLRIRGVLTAGRHEFGVGAASEGTIYAEGFREISYEHIRPIRLYRSSALYLQAIAVTIPRTIAVAYITGVSDAVAPALRGLDIPTAVLTPEELPLVDLSSYTTVVIGPRAYETHEELATQNPRLFEWVRGGGTLVVQYGQFEMARPEMMPYLIAFSRPAARVTLEDAPVMVRDTTSKLLRWPNRITAEDWREWVQERALYMPSTIDQRYRTPLAMNDPGEPENRGAILETTLGKGRYVYTTLSLFRQVPAGVPGSMRLLVNLLSAGIVPQQ